MLIDLDTMEQSLVRRRLRRWSEADEQTTTCLIRALQQRQLLSDVHIFKPRYETNVYPLYYYCFKETVIHRKVYDYVFRTLPTAGVSIPEQDVRKHVGHTVDSEIDILIEDKDYFIFLEAKEPSPKGRVKFERKSGVHQLVHQYLQGKILEGELKGKKKFVLATIGINQGGTLKHTLHSTEQALLKLVGEEQPILEVVDLSWDCLRDIATDVT